MLKRLPKNSVSLIVKFGNLEKLKAFLRSETYREALHKLSIYEGGKLEVLTSP